MSHQLPPLLIEATPQSTAPVRSASSCRSWSARDAFVRGLFTRPRLGLFTFVFTHRLAGLIICLLVGFSLSSAQLAAQTTQPTADPGSPPTTRRSPVLELYHGVEVADPYRWLEQTEAAETRGWVAAQNAYTARALATPSRAAIERRLLELSNYQRWGVPRVHGERIFYLHNDGLSNHARLLVIDQPDATPRPLLDPNTMATDGTMALANWKVSHDGRYLAYGISAAGSDLRYWHLRDVDTGRDLPEVWRCADVVWNADGRSMFYVRHDRQIGGPTDRGRYVLRLFYHQIGQSLSTDRLVYERGDDRPWSLDPRVTEDGRYLVLRISSGMSQLSQLLYLDLENPQATVQALTPAQDAQYTWVGSQGNQFWILTDRGAPRGQIIQCDVTAAEVDWERPWLDETEDLLVGASRCGGRWIVRYLRHGTSLVKVLSDEGEWLADVSLPGLGTVTGFESRSSDTSSFFGFSSYTRPLTIYRFDSRSLRSTVYYQPQLAANLDDYETAQHFYTSTDGTRVPMLLVGRAIPRAREELEQQQQQQQQQQQPVEQQQHEPSRQDQHERLRPTLLYGYGGFQISITPSFSVANLVWLELGGLLAVPSIRGGGEYGRAWHEAGKGERKEQSFADFIAAARYLIEERFTSSRQLAIHGTSNGGLLVGVAATQHPELFAAALPHVGVFDMLRYQHFSMGAAWIPEYGSAQRADEFARLWRYSPLHQVRQGVDYPAMLITTADHDDRVTPAHSYKFAAALQSAQQVARDSATDSTAVRNILLRVDERVGHGSGMPTAKLIASATDSLVFLTTTLATRDQE